MLHKQSLYHKKHIILILCIDKMQSSTVSNPQVHTLLIT